LFHRDLQSRIIPFRESKLTRLFQNYFMGRGKAAMIVNVNQLASMFDETMHVFKFSAIASKVKTAQWFFNFLCTCLQIFTSKLESQPLIFFQVLKVANLETKKSHLLEVYLGTLVRIEIVIEKYVC